MKGLPVNWAAGLPVEPLAYAPLVELVEARQREQHVVRHVVLLANQAFEVLLGPRAWLMPEA